MHVPLNPKRKAQMAAPDDGKSQRRAYWSTAFVNIWHLPAPLFERAKGSPSAERGPPPFADLAKPGGGSQGLKGMPTALFAVLSIVDWQAWPCD